MKFKIGGLEFDGDTTLEEMYSKLECKRAFEDFAKESMKKHQEERQDEETLQEIIDSA